MKQVLYTKIVDAKKDGKQLLAILLDPDKIDWNTSDYLVEKISTSPANLILVGGSIVISNAMLKLIDLVRSCNLSICIFPGHPSQISSNADALLLLSLISGRNPDYLIGHHVAAAKNLRNSGLEIIPTGYILIDGDSESAVKRVSETTPISQKSIDEITSTAIAGELLGNKLIYLEAGSGANRSVSPNIISTVCQNINIPLLVGGGITSAQQIADAFLAGATVVVIGTAFENDLNFFANI